MPPPAAFVPAPFRQGGHPADGQRPVLDLSQCANPTGRPADAVAVLEEFLAGGSRFDELGVPPDDAAAEFLKAYAADMNFHAAPDAGPTVDSDQLLPGRGVTEFIELLADALRASNAKVAVITPEYTGTINEFGDFADFSGPTEPRWDTADLRLKRVHRAMETHRYVIFSNPSNPLGHYLKREDLLDICRGHPTSVLIADEEYIRFQPDARSLVGADVENLVVWQSVGKSFGIVGCRAGVMWTRNDELRGMIHVPKWPLSLFDVAVAVAALKETSWLAKSLRTIKTDAYLLEQQLGVQMGFSRVSGSVHFRFVHLDDPVPLANYLRSQGIRVRAFRGDRPGQVAGIRVRTPIGAAARERLGEAIFTRPADLRV
ncbi:aminotransferase class I/II-fold pyridoxal phosphate-dependent enzyme [Streptomyces niveus]|uniref:aminotransferase class I/II-fold pyridoxal phosphate-dependent enzyme n=1 Tax=Streptomyces niveus TaxID=193462 RepID=UPI0034381760